MINKMTFYLSFNRHHYLQDSHRDCKQFKKPFFYYFLKRIYHAKSRDFLPIELNP